MDKNSTVAPLNYNLGLNWSLLDYASCKLKRCSGEFGSRLVAEISSDLLLVFGTKGK